MREILFRGKRIDNGEWVVGIPWIFSPPVNKAVIVYAMGLVGEDDDTSRYCECHEVDPSTIGQYTGLTDKNGKKIFEGDIVKITHVSTGDERVTAVMYGSGSFGVKHEDRSIPSIIPLRAYDCYSQIEIIGNIHDNPELLEDKP